MVVMTEKPFLTPEEVARMLGITERTLQDQLRKGTFPGVKIGKEWRIARDELEAYLKRNSNQKRK